jgi:hypothetical protein
MFSGSGRMWTVSGALLLVLLGSVSPANAQLADKYADRTKVVEYAVKNFGKRIGRGECTDLVNAALRYANAQELQKRPKSNVEKFLEEKQGFMYPDEAYIWGIGARSLGKGPNRSKRTYDAGQILQFEYCYFEKPDKTRNWDMWHHTAIVKSANGTMVTLLHQNAPKGAPVSEGTLDLNWLTPHPKGNGKNGNITAFYPMKK